MFCSLDRGAEDDHLVVIQLAEEVHKGSGFLFLKNSTVVLEETGEGQLALVVNFDFVRLWHEECRGGSVRSS